MKAVILAGGRGSRLRPIIGEGKQKVMYEYSNKPLLHRTIDMLKEKGYTDIILVVSHLKEQIIDYFGDGKKFGVNIEYVVQENPKGGTADATKTAREKINDNQFLLIYGDNVFSSETLDDLINKHDHFDGILCGHEVENPQKFGVLQVNGVKVEKIIEKPINPPSNLVMTGLFILPKEIFSAIDETKLSPRGEYELTESIQILIDKGKKFGYTTTNLWYDPRDKEEINKANEIVSQKN